MPPREKRRREVVIREKLALMPELKRADVVATYWPIKGEVDLRGLEGLLDATFCLPKVVGSSLGFGRPERLVEGAFGILEPEVADVPLCEIDVFLVPGVAYDLEGFRLGYGGGYYDRLIAGKLPHQLFVGVAFEFQLVEELPRDGWDVPVDVVLTDASCVYPVTASKIR